MSNPAPQTQQGHTDSDAGRLDDEGHLMLGEFRRKRCYHASEMESYLQVEQAKRNRGQTPVSEELKKAIHYCRRFKTIKSEGLTKHKDHLMRKVEFRDATREHGPIRRAKRLREFEAAQLIQLMPATKEEAIALIPTLDGNPWIEELIQELMPLRESDRPIG